MADLVISEFMDEAAVAELARKFDLLYDPTLVDDPARLQAALGAARGFIVRNRTQVTAELLAAAPGLTAVGRLGVGLDNIDLAACEARGIDVYPATGANAVAVAEYVLGSLLILLRGVFEATPEVAAGDWPRGRYQGREASGKMLGLVGLGGIALLVAERARPFGMTIAAYDPFVPAGDPRWAGVERVEDLNSLLGVAEVLSLHVPLTEETRNLLDAAALARMKPEAVVINTARGGIVDEAALVAALKAGKLGGAALDVFTEEPLQGAAAARFAGAPNLILTPHVAGVTQEANTRVSAMIAARMSAALGG